MSGSFIVHDDFAISRCAVLVEKRISAIEAYESLLDAEATRENGVVSREALEACMVEERRRLGDLLEDIENGFLNDEMESIRERYVLGRRNKDGL